MTRFIAIASAKGGSGKTVVAINLASALNTFGREVILIDTDLHSPNISIHLGTYNVPVTLNDVLLGKSTIEKATYIHPSGVRVIPSSLSFKEFSNPSLSDFTKVFSSLDNRAEIIIIDTPPGIQNENILKHAEETIVVTTPDLSSVTDALRTVKLAEHVGSTIIGIVITKRKASDSLTTSNIEDILGFPVISEIPFDEEVEKSLCLRYPVVFTQPLAKSSVEFKKLAARLIGSEYKPTLIEKKQSLLKTLGLIKK